MSEAGRPSESSPSDPVIREEVFVFLDARGRRWPRVRRVAVVAGALLFLAVVLFVQTLVVQPQLPLPAAVEQLKARLKASPSNGRPSPQKATIPLWQQFTKAGRHALAPPQAVAQTHPAGPVPLPSPTRTSLAGREIRLGFYEGWDPASVDSLKAHADQLTHLCPDWLTLADSQGKLKSQTSQEVIDLAEDRGVTLMPLLRNLGSDDAWSPEAVEAIINGPADRRQQFTINLVDTLQAMHAGGVVIDWQQVDPAYKANLTAFFASLAATLHASGLEVWLCVPPGHDLRVYDIEGLAPHVDRFVAMLHDENAESDPPGPITSREFFEGWLAALVDGYGTPSQWIISLGSYGYDWTEGKEEAEHIGFQDVMSRAGRASLTGSDFDARSRNPHFMYEEAGTVHSVWFLDAITFLNQLMRARQHRAGGVAISRLGIEDPGIWQVLAQDPDKRPDQEALAPLETIAPGEAIAHIGQGNLISVNDDRADGSRRIAIEPDAGQGFQATARYEVFPRYLTVLHQGGSADKVAITFDDGPDEEWTPQLLDVLKAKGVSAAFFLIGANMEAHPELVERIVREGHMIGVHTYSHPNLAEVSEERARLEFNATQRLTESITGHSTMLFRPPYNADSRPRSPEELIPVKQAQAMGYLTVTEDIDTEDWDQPEAATMVGRVKAGRQQGGNIVLLHDAGGDRSRTVEALPLIIDYLRARGDAVAPLPELLDIPAAQLMPVVPHNQQPVTRMISEGGFRALHAITNFFWAFMIVATGLTILKTLAVVCLAVAGRRQSRAAARSADNLNAAMPVSVLMAAFNEEKVIAETLHSLLRTSYPGILEILVVDDGSTDDTAAIVATMAGQDSRIRLIRQNNRGKAQALRNGLAQVSHGIVVSLDADTQFTPETIGHLVTPFADPKVGAVSGRARVGNPRTLFARLQSLEYTCGFNLDRQAYHLLNCITVAPGAVSAFRLQAIRDAGGISTETLAEDTDLTLSLHQCGYTICYAPRAVAWTEAPETMSAFARQRFRWAFGTLQCLWKHRDLLFSVRHGALGWFSLPSAWFFNILLVALGSIIDLLLLCSLVLSPANPMLLVYFFIFLAADLLLAVVACLIEREPLRQVWLVLPMRFLYRPVLNYVVIMAIIRACKGVWVGWGKLDRTASVTCGPQAEASK